ncbi:MAG: MarR family transcriptional regulator [Clostridia bacterium]|nr:MarR family transcriptional regulator [Clostridia bacterium]
MKGIKSTFTEEQKNDYLGKILMLLQKREGLVVNDKKLHFNNTELRMIGEILSEGYQGKRLISTRLATRLGITRSAVSQIVNRLEARGVVKRVPDDTDKKIAYIELCPSYFQMYQEDVTCLKEGIACLIERFGEKKFNEMYSLFISFADLVEDAKKECTAKNKERK